MVTRRKGEMVSMENTGERINLEFNMPSRGIIGLRTNVLTASAGEAIMAHRFKEYQPYKGEIERRLNGSIVSMEAGTAFAYALDKLQDRGRFFIFPQDDVYAGQVVGEHAKDNDLVVNVTKSKKLTNMRASGSDDKARIIPPVQFSLEEALEYIKEDEYVEVTPKSMRMRKIILDENERKRSNKSYVITSYSIHYTKLYEGPLFLLHITACCRELSTKKSPAKLSPCRTSILKQKTNTKIY